MKIYLDTETTGLHASHGHRLIEVAAIQVDGDVIVKEFHAFLNPEREIDVRAAEVHGITWNDLKDKPKFEDIKDSLLDFLGNHEIIIHNANFDVNFLNHEFRLAGLKNFDFSENRSVICTLVLARELAGIDLKWGRGCKLDDLKEIYNINIERDKHDAVTDTNILMNVHKCLEKDIIKKYMRDSRCYDFKNIMK